MLEVAGGIILAYLVGVFVLAIGRTLASRK